MNGIVHQGEFSLVPGNPGTEKDKLAVSCFAQVWCSLSYSHGAHDVCQRQ